MKLNKPKLLRPTLLNEVDLIIIIAMENYIVVWNMASGGGMTRIDVYEEPDINANDIDEDPQLILVRISFAIIIAFF